MKNLLYCLCFLLLGSGFFACNPKGDQQELTVEWGEIPHSAGPVFVKISGQNEALQIFALKNSEGKSLPLQSWKDSTWVFMKEEGAMNRGDYTLEILKEAPSNAVHFEKSANGISAKVGEKPVFTFNTSTLMPPEGLPDYYQRSGFIHPMYSPSGQILTDGFPVGHAHQHGIFITWVNTTFKGEEVDFWNQQDEQGTVRLLEVTDTLSGPVFGQLKAQLEHVSLKDGPALTEDWTITIYNTNPHFLIDFQSDQKTAGADTLYLNQYHYGGFAYRAAREWNPDDSLHYQSKMQTISSLSLDRANSNHTRPEWIAGYGTIDGQTGGLAVFDHPSNFRFPQFVRVHPEMPYFCFPPVVEEGFVMAPGDQYTSRYRLLVFSGEPQREALAKVWEDYTH